MKKILDHLFASPFTQAMVTALIYCFYAAVLGIALVPSVVLLLNASGRFLNHLTPAHIVLFSIACGFSVFLYFITGTLVYSSIIRLISWGIKPGRYPIQSLTMVRWLLYNGLYYLAGKTILEYVPMSFLVIIFFRIFGARIGRNAGINTWFLNDAFLLEIGDNVVIGGKTDISCHTFERGQLILERVKIGSDSLVGQGCYVSPGVTIGKKCVIGQYALIRKNKNLPDKTVISAIAGLPIRAVAEIEKHGE